MAVRVYRPLLLLLALLAGQWLAVAHAHDHPAIAVDQVCALCVHAPGLDTPPLAAAGACVIADAQAGDAPTGIAGTPCNGVPLVLRNRGPPVF
jgi:hypothetical protein